MKTKLNTPWLTPSFELIPLLTTIIGIAALSSTFDANGGKPQPPPPPPADSGTIYFNYNNGEALQVWSMKPDGTVKIGLPVLNVGSAEPSRTFHNGRRWFLTLQVIPGEFYAIDPNGNEIPRQEVYAISDQGEWLQLTDDPAIEAWDVRWTLGAAGVDGRITVVAHRWVQDANGNPISIEPGIYYVDVDPDTWTAAPPTPQSPQRLDTILLPVAEDEVGFYANIAGYDWSPDGTHVVYAASEGLYVVQAADGANSRLLAVAEPYSPRWSPVQATGHTRILFGVGLGHSCRIDRVNDDGTGWMTVVPVGSSSEVWVIGNSVRWSPGGSHFIYDQWTMDRKVSYRRKSSHIWRAAADGSGKTDLTAQMTFSYALGWKNP